MHDFFVTKDGRIGVVIRNDQTGGVFRGHMDVWFGEATIDGVPIIKQILVEDCLKLEETPRGNTD